MKVQRSPAPAPSLRDLVNALDTWFRAHHRDLPWRHTIDPYAIWVSEVMLQQTQVTTVVPFYQRWMAALPTIKALADASSEQLHKLWEGLGYYSRVRNLQKAAQQIQDRHQGRFPRVYEQVLDLPGIGRYTAGAICSIAFGQPTPILDGNVIRVLCRLFGINGDPTRKGTNNRLWTIAEQLVREAHAQAGNSREAKTQAARPTSPVSAVSSLNQALMELGAMICLPRQPACATCPVFRMCAAHLTDRVDSLPRKRLRAPVTQRHFAGFIVSDRGKFLVRQRPAGVVNAHLWEFPNGEIAGAITDPEILAKKVLGVTACTLVPACTVRHSITRYRITLRMFHARTENTLARRDAAMHWAGVAELQKLAFAAAHKKVVFYLLKSQER